jgi:RNA polymerase sigma-70 factor (ECF subfamily)
MGTLDPQSLTRHVDRLYRAAWALCGSREDAEDLVQETFVRVLARERQLTGDNELHYLMGALRNTFLINVRTRSRRPAVVAQLDELSAVDSRPTGRPDSMIEVSELYGAIAELAEDFRLALVAVDIVGLSYREAAGVLDVKEATLTTRVFRARRSLARSLGASTEQEPGQPSRESGREDSRPGGVLSGGSP